MVTKPTTQGKVTELPKTLSRAQVFVCFFLRTNPGRGLNPRIEVLFLFKLGMCCSMIVQYMDIGCSEQDESRSMHMCQNGFIKSLEGCHIGMSCRYVQHPVWRSHWTRYPLVHLRHDIMSSRPHPSRQSLGESQLTLAAVGP